jgi:adenylate cyclase
MILVYAGEPAEAVATTERALRLNPSPPPGIRQIAGIVFYNARQYDRAIAEMKAVSAVWSDARAAHEYLAAAYAHVGRLDLARSEAGLIPDYTLPPKPSLALTRLWYEPYYKRAEDLNHHLEGLKAAGIPEWPFGFEGRAQDQVIGQELSALAIGRTWTGYSPVHIGENAPFVAQFDRDNHVVYRSTHTLVSGTTRLEKDRICVLFDGYLPNLWLCGTVYRNVAASNEPSVDYVYVLPDGLRYFSVKD